MFVHRIRAVNDTDAPLKVAKFETSCACTGYRLHGESIPPHGELPIDLIIDLREEDASLPRDFSTSVSLTVEAASGRQVLQSAVVTGRVESSPITLPLWASSAVTVIQGIDEDAPRTTALTTKIPLGDLDVEPDGTIVRTAELRAADSKGHCQLTFALDPELPLGPFAGYVTITATADVQTDSCYVPISGRVVADACTIPSQLAWGAQPVGSMVREHLILRTRSGRSISRVEVVDKPEGMMIKAVENELSAASHIFRVETPVVSLGSVYERLLLKMFIEGETDPYRVEVPVALHGVQANAH